MKKIIFATSNQGKLKEIREILSDMDCEIISLKEAGIDIDIVEDGSTFEENALIKANTIMKLTNTIVLADDSGLEVDYLDKKPGIYSARFLGEDTPQIEKNKYILDKLRNVEEDKRTARFVCCVACAIPNRESITVRGIMEGKIAHNMAGENGFGYDPIFYVKEYDKTVAELNSDEKNDISHRGRALRLMKEKLKNMGIIM